MTTRTLTAMLLALASLSAAPAMAADEAPISTGAKTSSPQAAAEAGPATVAPAQQKSTSDQIANYLATSPAANLDDGESQGVITGDGLHREIHGVVDVSVGNHGYRNIYARSDIPIGKTGQLSIAVQQGQGRGLYGPGYGYGYGPGYYGGYGYGRGGFGDGSRQSFALSFNSDVSDSWRDRCRDDGYDGRIVRPDAECRRIIREEPRL
jgi:hypothetical protein